MNFQDKWTRWHHKPIPDGKDYSSGNGWIYTAECESVGLPVSRASLWACYGLSLTPYGFTRHPDEDNPGISHDEVIGAAYLLGDARKLTRQWEKQYWQICDLPGFKPTPWYRLNWFGVIKDFWAIYQAGRLYEKSGGKEGMKERHATQLYPRVFPIAFHMGGWKRYLIKRHTGVNPSIYEKLSFLFAKLVTIYGSKGWTPGKRILGFQLLMLNNETLIEKVLSKCYASRYNLKEIAAEEYKPGHPILEKL